MKKIVIASDSFKGSLSSMEVADAAEAGIIEVGSGFQVVKIPVADGGEGTIDALVSALQGERVDCEVHDPLMNPIRATYAILGDGNTAVIETSAASGLTLVPADKRNPMMATTYGTGELIRDALLRGCRNFLIGIGGSATYDAGTGMLQALGFRFLDEKGEACGKGGQMLGSIRSIDKSGVMPELQQATFTIACDVNNPFSGPNGAAFIYARQKGADDRMIRQLDKGLKNLAGVIRETQQTDLDTVPGAGAAGGLGGGFLAFLGATLKPGIQMVLETLRFDERIKGADLIIAGEGRLDKQTAMGKTPAGILAAGSQQHIPVVAIAGAVEDWENLHKQGFKAVFSIQPGPLSLEQAMDKTFAAENIKRTVAQLIRLML